MEIQSLIPSGEIKQEPDYETKEKAERNFPFLREYIKQELDSQAVKKEANGEKESYMSPVIKETRTSATSSCPEDDSFLYCEKCQLKYEGGCQEHGPLIYVDNAEKGEGCSQDSSLQDLVADYKDGQGPGEEKVEQSHVCEAHSDDVGTLPNRGCSTESDEMYYVCEMNTELCVAGTSCEEQSNDENKTQEEHYYTCDICGAKFDFSIYLKVHKRTHKGEKPYKCDAYGLGFARSKSLTTHKRTHTEEKPYKCDVCGLGFAFSIYLKVHKRTHQGEQPW